MLWGWDIDTLPPKYPGHLATNYPNIYSLHGPYCILTLCPSKVTLVLQEMFLQARRFRHHTSQAKRTPGVAEETKAHLVVLEGCCWLRHSEQLGQIIVVATSLKNHLTRNMLSTISH